MRMVYAEGSRHIPQPTRYPGNQSIQLKKSSTRIVHRQTTVVDEILGEGVVTCVWAHRVPHGHQLLENAHEGNDVADQAYDPSVECMVGSGGSMGMVVLESWVSSRGHAVVGEGMRRYRWRGMCNGGCGVDACVTKAMASDEDDGAHTGHAGDGDDRGAQARRMMLRAGASWRWGISLGASGQGRV